MAAFRLVVSRLVARPLVPTAVALLAVLVGAACGGGDEVPSPTPDETPAASSPTPSPVTATGRLAYIEAGGNLALIDPDGTDGEVVTEGGGVDAFLWSPDGSQIAVTGGEGAAFAVRVMRPDGEAVFDIEEASVPVWSPQGDRLAVSRGAGLAVYNSSGAQVLEVAAASNATWSPDGATLAFLRSGGNGGGVPTLVDIASGDESAVSDGIAAEDVVYPIVWRPDGGAIAYRDGIYDLDTGEKTDLPGVPIFWSADGRVLMVVLEFIPADNSTPAQLLDMDQGGKPFIGLEIRPAADGTPAWLYIQRWIDWSPDERFLVYFDPAPARLRIRIYDTIAIRQSIFRDIAGERPNVSPDGTHASFMHEGKVWVLALDGSTLVDIAEGSNPAWQPVP